MLYRILKNVSGSYNSKLVAGTIIEIDGPTKLSTFFPFKEFNPSENTFTSKYYEGSSPSMENFQPLTSQEIVKYEQDLEVHKRNYIEQHTNFRASHTLGTDPEIFSVDQDGKLIPSFNFLPGKGEALWMADKGTYYCDGFASEFTVPVFTCCAYGVDSLQYMLNAIHSKLVKYNPQAKLSAQPIFEIPSEILASAPAEHVQLGCSPSKNIYELESTPVSNGRELPLRVSGYHIHATTKRRDGVTIEDRIRMMDRIAGVISVVALQGLEGRIRRRYYGLPGEYRTPSYGLEYRTLSGAVLWHPAIVHMLTQFARAGVQMAGAGLSKMWDASDEETIQTILDLDVDRAKSIIQRNSLIVERLLHHWYRDKDQPLHNRNYAPTGVQPPKVIIEQLLFKGFKEYIKLDVEKNWHLTDGGWKAHSEGPEANCWRFTVASLGRYSGKD